ncbi:MAG: DUF1848 domain-containing protein [Candidatus Adiutrix sp.]|jgi:hypothetical protein|nr:DUF1848 domain-containing protein [Candidatus Adiutrix sp.]
MILSVSRRTDIPAFYFRWFLGRLRAGYALTRNPMNPRRVSRIDLRPEVLDFIVFWSKNPGPMLEQLEALGGYQFYVQFTVNAYGRDLEGGLPDKPALVDTFRRLAGRLGPERLLWRYDPVVLSPRYSPAWQTDSFGRLAEALKGCTDECKLSFLQFYPKIKKRLAALGIYEPDPESKAGLAGEFLKIGAETGLRLRSCGDPALRRAGLEPSRCIDPERISRLTGRPLNLKKDPGQRLECGCAPSIDLGTYGTCPHACQYCYANYSAAAAEKRHAAHDPASPLLCGFLGPGDILAERRLRSHFSEPAGFF